MSKKAIILVILIFIGTVLITTGVYAANEVATSNSNTSSTQQTQTSRLFFAYDETTTHNTNPHADASVAVRHRAGCQLHHH